ncbi:MAG: 23S rRNA (pseudouridine(1915)-N(3))-methyltransferase RlmH [Actinomycetes bacterium]|jgi:23S rRNA (pseudouridine1915-N3)-methyltransferase|nr:23S rRNA (pseudouridine(1915)-N(3))-methyltransferase RlmH [Actinomycetes bacterium]
MKLTLLVVGKLKEPWQRDAFTDYAKRLIPYVRLSVIDIADRDVDRLGVQRALADEAAELLRRMPADAHVVALTLDGRSYDSPGLAAHIEDLKTRGTSHLCFVIGGPAGLDPQVVAASHEQLSLGSMTWPHTLVRVMLAEQLYRACRISAGHPYHR